MRFYKIIYILVYFLFFCTSVHTTSHYVDKNAKGHNNGTSWNDAWKSFSDIDWDQIQPGDVLYISGGTDSTVYYETLTISNLQGTVDNPITIRNSWETNHNGRVIINAQGTTRSENIKIHSGTVEYVIIKGFELQEGNAGVKIYNNVDVNVLTLDSLLITDFNTLAGVFSDGPSSYPIDSLIVKNCDIISGLSGGQTDGMHLKGLNNTIIHNNFIHVRNLSNSAHADCIHYQNAPLGLKIYNNILIADSVWGDANGGGASIIWRSAPGGSGGDSTIIYNNLLMVHGRWAPTAGWGTNVFARWNTGEDTDPPLFAAHNTIVTRGPMEYPVGLEWPKVTTPTFINNIMAMFGSGLGSTPPYWFGIFRNSSGATYTVDSVRSNLMWREWVANNPHNYFSWGYWSGNGNTAQNFGWSTWSTTLGGTGINENPLFVVDMDTVYGVSQGLVDGLLQSTSPAINAGKDTQELIESMGLPWKYCGQRVPGTLGVPDGDTRPTSSTPTIGAFDNE